VTFNNTAFSALTFYLAAYAVANTGALALATYFTNVAQAEDMAAYRGLGHKYPVASVCFVIILISLTGIPVTAGFTGKLFVFSAAYGFYQQNYNILLLIMIITGAVTTVVALFYYINIPRNLFLKRSDAVVNPVEKSYNLVYFAVMISLLLVLLGIFPDLLLKHL